ncbi:BI1-like protein [Nymphaea thermarum]|nr:BI1-like protein [Nymphaea thermarum]
MLIVLNSATSCENFIESFVLAGAGSVILEAVTVTVLLAVSSTLYVFWAAKQDHDTHFLGSFLFGFLIAFICFGIFEIFFPFHKATAIIFGILRAVVFSGYIIHDTSNLLKRHGRDDNGWVSASVLYMDMINLFLHLLELLGSGEK